MCVRWAAKGAQATNGRANHCPGCLPCLIRGAVKTVSHILLAAFIRQPSRSFSDRLVTLDYFRASHRHIGLLVITLIKS